MTWKAPPGWRKLRAKVFATKGRQCFWCGRTATTVDHVIPAAAWQAQQAAELAEFTAQITGPNVHTQELGVPDGMLEDGGRS